jgi:hypothetical protein
MGFKVILTPKSVADLESIVTFIARDNLDRARTFGDELIGCEFPSVNLPFLVVHETILAMFDTLTEWF